VNVEKLTTDVGQEVRYALGHEEAQKFYTGAIKMTGSTNTGGLGWSEYRFKQVAWKLINHALQNKPDMFQIWHMKQCIRVCAMRSQMACIQDILDSKCPNCKQEQEKSHQLVPILAGAVCNIWDFFPVYSYVLVDLYLCSTETCCRPAL
jgi:hypothetical protein